MSASARTIPPCTNRRLPETGRLARLFDMTCRIADAPGMWTRAALARRYEVSERQITKDLDLLRHTLRVDIRKVGQAGGYALARPVELSWLRR